MRKPPLIWVAALAALAGCSLIYDPGSFTATDAAQQPDGMPDARPIDAQILDADIENLDITGTLPVDLAEGSGCIWDTDACTEDARAIPIIVTGSNIAADAVVTLDGAGYTAQVVPAAVHENHEQLAIAVRIPPDLGIDDTGTATLTITVTQGVAASDFTEVTVAGLNDFVASGAGATVNVSTLDARYATVNIDANIVFTGDEPVRLTATSAITVGATIDVSGGNGGNTAAFGAAGPGGCPGAAAEGSAGCGDSGGGSGGTSTGGGGGGHRIAGTAGSGQSSPGSPGAEAGDETMAPLGEPDGSRGNGGGGGGRSGALNNAGGAGGGGGGTIVLTSGGSLTVTATGNLISNGGSGGAGGGACAVLNQHGGGGGGGSGGGVLLRGWGLFVDEGGDVSVTAGNGGNGGCNAGGNGAAGRVRVDLPSAATDPGLVSGTSAFRGIVIDPALPAVVTSSPVTVAVFGAPSHDGYRIQVEGLGDVGISTVSDRTGSAMLDLTPGMNRICVLQNDIVNASSNEGAQCVSIAFMPQ